MGGENMIKTELLNVAGTPIQGICIQAPGGQGHPNMLILLAKKGYVMCGYLNQDAAKKFGDAACVVSGASFNEILSSTVKSVSPEAEALGIQVGMTGAHACEILNKE